MTVPTEPPLAGARVMVETTVPLYALVMVTKGPVNDASVDPGVWTTTVPVESPLAGARVAVVVAVPV
jgi:hypothetical protein